MPDLEKIQHRAHETVMKFRMCLNRQNVITLGEGGNPATTGTADDFKIIRQSNNLVFMKHMKDIDGFSSCMKGCVATKWVLSMPTL